MIFNAQHERLNFRKDYHCVLNGGMVYVNWCCWDGDWKQTQSKGLCNVWQSMPVVTGEVAVVPSCVVANALTHGDSDCILRGLLLGTLESVHGSCFSLHRF